jgi:phosphomannomutase
MNTSEPLIISVSGLRGIMGKSLTPYIAIRYAAALAAELPEGPLVVTRDGRTSGSCLAEAIRCALSASGRHVVDGGIASTPTAGVLVASLGAAGGIQISASHNPPQYNGMKLFNAAGRVIPASEGAAVLARFDQFAACEPAWATTEALGDLTTLSSADSISTHLAKVLQLVDVERIRRCAFRVALDANHGSGSCLGRPLLEALGCTVLMLGGTPDGHFAHPPEPTAENLQSVLQQVVEFRADVGFCQDPDADRLAIIDERGKYLGEESTLALCVDHLLRTRCGPVVTNCSTSRMTEDLARRYGAPFFRSAVGEANVVDLMLREQAVLGGEGNGGVIEPRVGLVRDSFAGMAHVLDALAARKIPVSALAAELPQYAICKAKIELSSSGSGTDLTRLKSVFTDAEVSSLDGLRFDWEDGAWLLVRASNTEPIVRAVAEATSEDRARRLCELAKEALGRS